MTPLITIADFAGIVAFSGNISAATSLPYISKAQEIDLWPLLPDALRTELLTPRSNWSAATVTLFDEKVKPVLVHEAARRIMLWHDTHVTPDSLEELATDMNRTPASSQRRAVLSASLQADCAHYRALLETALRLAYPPAATSCGGARRRPGAGGLTVSAL